MTPIIEWTDQDLEEVAEMYEWTIKTMRDKGLTTPLLDTCLATVRAEQKRRLQ